MSSSFRNHQTITEVASGLSERKEWERTVSYDNTEMLKKRLKVSGTTPVALDLSEISNVNLFAIKAEYQSDDTAAGVAAGDPAEIELELNGSGQYETLKSLTIEGEVTSVSIRVNAAITQTLLVTYLIGGADT